jgi:hypothetical protein
MRFLSPVELSIFLALATILITLCFTATILTALRLFEFFGLKKPPAKRSTSSASTSTPPTTTSSVASKLSALLPQHLKFHHALAIAVIYFLWLLALTYTAYQLFPGAHTSTTAVQQMSFVDFWHQTYLHGDGRHYFNLAHHGYRGVPDMRMQIFSPYYLLAFYPLYPFLVFLTNHLFDNFFTTTLLLNFILAPLVIYWLFKVIRREQNALIAWIATALFLVFPWSFAMFLPYTENLFLLLTLLVFWFIGEKKWYFAAIAGFLAALTRTPGVLMCIPIGLALFQRYRFQLKHLKFYIFAAVPILGTLFYLSINYLVSGNPFQFLIEQREVWHNFGVTPFLSLAVVANWAVQFSFAWIVGRGGSLVFLLMISFLTLIWAAKQRPKSLHMSYLVYAMFYLLLSFSISNPISGTRYIFALFPLFMYQAKFLSGKLWLLPIFLIVLLSLLIFYWSFLTMGVIIA